MADDDDVYSDITWQDDYVLDTHAKFHYCLTRVAATITVLSAICILMETVEDVRSGSPVHNTTTTRLLLAIQIGLILAGSVWMVGVTAAPSFIEDAWGATGNIFTCELTGFLHCLGTMVVICYDTTLSITYVLMVRYSWRSSSLWKLERIVHIAVIPVALALTIPPWLFGFYNYDGSICYIESFPSGCEGHECIRGGGTVYLIFRLIHLGLGTLMPLLAVSCMLSIFCFVRKMESKNAKYLSQYYNNAGLQDATCTNHSTSNNSISCSMRFSRRQKFQKTRRTAVQGIRYASTSVFAGIPMFLAAMLGIHSPIFLDIAICSYGLHGFYYLIFFLGDRQTMRTGYGRFWKWLLYRERKGEGGQVNFFCRCCCCFHLISGQCSELIWRKKVPSTTTEEEVESDQEVVENDREKVESFREVVESDLEEVESDGEEVESDKDEQGMERREQDRSSELGSSFFSFLAIDGPTSK